jgi:hypothetical protein
MAPIGNPGAAFNRRKLPLRPSAVLVKPLHARFRSHVARRPFRAGEFLFKLIDAIL